ncbi:MAG: hypothetical protein J1E06_11735 [Acutalibacter sp.]|nr:hypothetical protein [Acutalibacter sp.]
MDDLNQQINQILSDPQSMQQLQSMASALGLGNNQQAAPPPAAPAAPANGGIDPSALAGMLSTLGAANPPAPAPAQPALGGITPELLQTVSRLAPLLSQVNREDDSTRLLQALRPLLSEKRQKKLDEAVKILQMMRLMPLLKDSGLFSGLLSGLL